LRFGEVRRTTCLAENLLKETATFAGFGELCAAQFLAAFVKTRLFRKNLVKDNERVVQVIAFDRGEPFFVQLAFDSRNFVERLLWHR